MTWSPDDIGDLSGSTAVVTGANSGIGYHTALELARHGAAVTLAVRTLGKGEAAAAAIRRSLVPASAPVRVQELDLASLRSVRAFTDRWEGPLDLLVNNAGVMAPPSYRQTADGFERQLGTNHLGHFALTGRLLPALLSAAQARVVTVASLAHRQGDASVLHGNPSEGYALQRAYGNSKLANLLFAAELGRRGAGTTLTSVAAHPGVSRTNLFTSDQGLGSVPGMKIVAPVARLLLQPSRAGANPSLLAATAQDPGFYTGPQRLRETRGPVGPARLSPAAQDERLAERLWRWSEEQTEVTYPWGPRSSG